MLFALKVAQHSMRMIKARLARFGSRIKSGRQLNQAESLRHSLDAILADRYHGASPAPNSE